METSSKASEIAGSAALLQVVSFELGKEVFAIDILEVQEIIRMLEITQVPNAPESVEGVINLRGKVIPVVDLRKKLCVPIPEANPQERIVVVKMEGKPVGMIVDAVAEVLRFSRDTVEPAPAMVSGIDSQFVSGVAKIKDRLLILLDVKRFLAIPEQSTA